MKTRLVIMGALISLLPLSMKSQEAGKDDFSSHFFVQPQAGIHLPYNSGASSPFKVLKPAFGFNAGAWIAPVVGTRIGAEFLKSGMEVNDQKYSFDYCTIDWDLLLNLSALFSGSNNPRGKLYLVGGVGLIKLGDKDIQLTNQLVHNAKATHNLRAGLGFEYRLAKPFSISAEYRHNWCGDDFYGKLNTNDMYGSLMVGLTFNFGFDKEPYYTPTLQDVERAATNALSLYEQKEAEVNRRMDIWMKRQSGESRADFELRTSSDKIASMRLENSKEVSTNMAGNRITTNLSGLQYNQSTGTLRANFTDMPSISLNVPYSDVSGIDTKNLKFSNTVYDLYPGDKFEVLYTEVLNPATGKSYTFIKQRDVQTVQNTGFVPLQAVQQNIINTNSLQAVRDRTVAEAKNRQVLSDNTTINVASELIPLTNGKADYKVSYNYTVKEGFSVKEDFAPGKYDAANSPASTAMLKIINESLNTDFAQYVKAGKPVTIKYTGSADATPIRSKIAYNGKYGDINDQPVNINGKADKLSVTSRDGITSNEQLSLVRARSVRDYIMTNVSQLKNSKITESYDIEVSDDKGSQFRRVAVEFIFHEAY